MATKRPLRDLSEILQKVSDVTANQRRIAFSKLTMNSVDVVNGGKLRTRKEQVEALPPVNGIAPYGPPIRGIWLLIKPAGIDMIPQPSRTNVLSPVTSVQEYLSSSPLVRETFPKGTRLRVLHGLRRTSSGLLSFAVESSESPSSTTQQPVILQHQYHALVWGHLRPTRLVESHIDLNAFVRTDAVKGARPHSAGVLGFRISHAGYFAGHPASVLSIVVSRPLPEAVEHLDWESLLPEMCQAQRHPAIKVNTRTSPPLGHGTLIGSATDPIVKQYRLDIPRVMLSLSGQVLLPSDGDPCPIKANCRVRFLDFLSDKSAAASLEGMMDAECALRMT